MLIIINLGLSLCAQIPSFEMVVDRQLMPDKVKFLRHVLEFVQQGDIVYGTVVRGKTSTTSTAPVLVKVLCTAEPNVRLFIDTNLKVHHEKYRFL